MVVVVVLVGEGRSYRIVQLALPSKKAVLCLLPINPYNLSLEKKFLNGEMSEVYATLFSVWDIEY